MAERSRTSAGLLLFRRRGGDAEVLLGHMGGPYWSGKDERAWSIPKGEYEETAEPAQHAARREFAEELGSPPPDAPMIDLGEVRQRNGKRVRAWAIEGDFDPDTAVSNTFEMEWPPRSGRMQAFPEIDRASWFGLDDARNRLVAAQEEFVTRLAEVLSAQP